jgi:hypothetical protein
LHPAGGANGAITAQVEEERMAEKPKQAPAQGDRQTGQQEERTRPDNPERTHGHERPMDDPGRGHGDKLEDEIPHGSGQNPRQR